MTGNGMVFCPWQTSLTVLPLCLANTYCRESALEHYIRIRGRQRMHRRLRIR